MNVFFDENPHLKLPCDRAGLFGTVDREEMSLAIWMEYYCSLKGLLVEPLLSVRRVYLLYRSSDSPNKDFFRPGLHNNLIMMNRNRRNATGEPDSICVVVSSRVESPGKERSATVLSKPPSCHVSMLIAQGRP